MGEVFVVNASPPITLAEVGHLTPLTDLAEAVLIPHAIVVEVLAGPESHPARQMLEGEVRGPSIAAYQQPWSYGVLEQEKLRRAR